jgi:hypothetical protein
MSPRGGYRYIYLYLAHDGKKRGEDPTLLYKAPFYKRRPGRPKMRQVVIDLY